MTKQSHLSTSLPSCKKLEKEYTNKQIKKITTDLPKRARTWETVCGTGEMGGDLYPQALQSGMRTESGGCGDSPYHHGGRVFVSWMMVICRVVNQWFWH